MEPRKIRICILIRALKSGGAEKQSVLLSNALNPDYEVYLVVQHGNILEKKHKDFMEKNKIQYVLLKGNLLKRIRTFYVFLKEHQINIIFSYLTSDNFWAGVIGRLAGVNFLVGGVRSIVLPWPKFYVTKLLQHYFLDFVVFNSRKGYENFVAKGFDRRKAVIIHNYIDPPRNFSKRKPDTIINIITVARFVEGKDYLTAIKAIHYLIKQFTLSDIELHYFIIGFGKLEKKIREWVNLYNLNKYVEIIIRPENIEKYYGVADVYLCSSTEEGLSNSIMEAMSYSLPVVATNAGDNSLLVKDGVTGTITPQRSYKKLAVALNEFVKSHEKRLEFGSRGYQHIKEEFSCENFKNKYTSFIESMKL